MLVDFKIRNSKRADEILQAIAEKRHEIDSLCYELRECLMLEAEIKKSSYGHYYSGAGEWWGQTRLLWRRSCEDVCTGRI